MLIFAGVAFANSGRGRLSNQSRSAFICRHAAPAVLR